MALILKVKVVPSSGRSIWTIDRVGTLKCFLKSHAERGKANTELVKRLGTAIGITRDNISILAGATSRLKMIKINADISLDFVLDALGVARQETFLVNS